MSSRIFPLLFLVTIIAACGCMAPDVSERLPSATTPSGMESPPLSLSINATPSRYNPAMSSTIGIRLTAENISGILPPDAQYRWETDFGTFYHWGPPDFRVVELAQTYSGGMEPVYWSYFSEHGEKQRRPVTITLIVTDPPTGTFLGNATLRIGWEDPYGFTAVVEEAG